MRSPHLLWDKFSAVAAHVGNKPLIVEAETGAITYQEVAATAEKLSLDLVGALAMCPLTSNSAPPRILITCQSVAHALVALLATARSGCTAVITDASKSPTEMGNAFNDLQCTLQVHDIGPEFGKISILRHQNPKMSNFGDSAQSRLTRSIDDPFYIICTSGSSGTRKAVLQSERNLVAHIEAYGRSIQLNVADRLTLIPALGTDSGFMDAFGALLHGATLLPWNLRQKGLVGMYVWLAENEATVLHCTPSLLAAMLESIQGAKEPNGIRVVVCGGEPLMKWHLKRFSEVFRPGTRLVNGYGPTECTLVSQLQLDTPSEYEDGLIGREIPGIDVIIDNGNGPVPPYQSGEMVILSDRLALGYAGDAEANLRFMEYNGRRAYRSGDQGWRDAKGLLHFVGRLDSLVKVHGQFVDCAKLTAMLSDEKDIAECYIALDSAGLLCAWLAPKEGARIDLVEIRTRLFQRGAFSHEVPRRIEIVPSLPRTNSGKVDLNLLCTGALRHTRYSTGTSVPTHDDFVRGAIQRTLQTDQLDMDRSFFENGGDSLGFMLLMAELEQHLGQSRLKAEMAAQPLSQIAALSARRTSEEIAVPTPSATQILRHSELEFWLSETLHAGLVTPRLHVTVALPARISFIRLKRCLEEVLQDAPRLAKRVSGEDEGCLKWADCLESNVTLELLVVERARFDSSTSEILRSPLSCVTGPPFRAVVLEDYNQAKRLVFVAHHAYLDGFAIRAFVDRWFALYDGHSQGHLVTAEIIKEENDDLSSNAVEWWFEFLRGTTPARCPLPPEPITAPAGHRGSRLIDVPEAVLTHIRMGSKIHGQMPFAVWLLSFASALEYTTGQSSLAIPSTASGRGKGVPIHAIGCFINSIYLRCDLAPDSRRADIMMRCIADLQAAFAHQGTPRQLVKRRMGWHDHSVAIPDVYFSYHSWRDDVYTLDGEQTSQLYFNDHFRVPLALDVVRLRAGTASEFFRATLSYDEKRIPKSIIDRFQRRLEIELAEWSRVGLGEASLKQRYPSLWERHVLQGEAPRCLPALQPFESFFKLAELRPETVAIRTGARVLTYGELAERVSSLAITLQRAGVKCCDLVPICTHDPTIIIATWLAAGSLGAGFVTLCADWPSAHIARLCQRYQFGMIVTCGTVNLPCEVLPLVPSIPFKQDFAPPTLWRTAGSLNGDMVAYGCFTSGTTGVPRLALISMSSLLNRLEWMQSTFDHSGRPVITIQTTPFEYDSAIWQVLWPLGSGGSVVVPDRKEVLSADLLLERIEEGLVTVIDFVPSVLAALMNDLINAELAQRRLRSVRYVIVGGEQVQFGPLKRLADWLSRAQIINLYGLTEATIGSVFKVIDVNKPTMALGRPISGTSVAIVDENRHPLPPGNEGYIVLGGACVGIGYLDDPEATANRFFRVTEGGDETARFVHTGDRGYLSELGEIHFRGRNDFQVKRYGIRIDLEAIEGDIEMFPGVHAAKVVFSPPDHLITFMTGSANPDDLLTFCRQRLPRAHIPNRVVALKQLPLTAVGKIDRRALAALAKPLLATPASTAEVESLQHGSSLTVIRKIWERLLDVDVSPDVSFFELGGHSLLALSAVAELTRELGKRISISMLFANPTARQLAAAIDEIG